MTITYRTPGAWGPGKGANLTAAASGTYTGTNTASSTTSQKVGSALG